MGGVGKGVGMVYPLYFGIFVLLKKIVLKCVFQSLDSGYKFLQSSLKKNIIFMCMNQNVYPLSETQKRSPQVTLNHEPNSSFVFTTKKNVTN